MQLFVLFSMLLELFSRFTVAKSSWSLSLPSLPSQIKKRSQKDKKEHTEKHTNTLSFLKVARRWKWGNFISQWLFWTMEPLKAWSINAPWKNSPHLLPALVGGWVSSYSTDPRHCQYSLSLTSSSIFHLFSLIPEQPPG